VNFAIIVFEFVTNILDPVGISKHLDKRIFEIWN